jgi:hypothetical protein
MSERPKDHAWEALVEVTNADVATMRGALNKALAQIKTASAELDVEGAELALIIKGRAALYREVFPELPLTPTSLSSWWTRIEGEASRKREYAEEQLKRQARGTNLRSHSHCTTCGGDHYVVVSHRQPQPTNWMHEHKIEIKLHPKERGFEETAPCPVCNLDAPVLPGFWEGKRWEYGSEPGELVVSS